MENTARISGPPTVPLPTTLGATPNPNATPEAVGKQFEGIFTSLLIKQLRQTVDGESMFGKDPGDVVGGMFDHFLGEHIARAGGLGVGKMIRHQLERRTPRT